MWLSGRRRRHHRDDGDTIEDRYVVALAGWQARHGLNGLDLTPAQTERYRAVEGARGDVENAKRLIVARLRRQRGGLTDA